MNIGIVAKLSNLPAKTIRYYESVGVMSPATRNESGYRRYTDTDVQTLRFIHRARNLGFSVKDVSRLLSLWGNKRRASADVKALASDHIERIEIKLRELGTIRDALSILIRQCNGDVRPKCPILDELADLEKPAISSRINSIPSNNHQSA